MLAVFHQESSVTKIMNSVDGGTIVNFDSDTSIKQLAEKIRATAFDENGDIRKVPLDEEAFIPYDAKSQAQILGTFFKTCLEESA